LIVAVLFSIAFFRTAWVSEDAFITFRVIDNLLDGLGLTWNPGERVQVFTHPLWLAALTPAVWMFGEPFHASLLISYACLLLTLVVLTRAHDKWTWRAILILLLLLESRSFVDYSSSGLENPLTHLLLALFALSWQRSRQPGTSTFQLALLTSAIYLSRPDAVVLVAPALLTSLRRTRAWSGLVAGLSPWLIWELFSLFYFGSLVPNTAFAKAGAGISTAQKFSQAQHYFSWSAINDPVTIILLVLGMVIGLRQVNTRPISLGLAAWGAYLFAIGADYMGGRFFSDAVILADIILLWSLGSVERNVLRDGMLVITFVIGIPTLPVTLFSPASYSVPQIDPFGISDERGAYYPTLGLIPTIEQGSWLIHPWFRAGYFASKHPGTYTSCNIGISGLAGGSGVLWIDPLAIADPFLARLPARDNTRPGHYERAFPAGYLESIVTGENRLVDAELNVLYTDVMLATRAPLMDPDRLGAIWRLNSGDYSNLAGHFDKNAAGDHCALHERIK